MSTSILTQQTSFDEIACIIDDEGFNLAFDNDLAGGARHTRWYSKEKNNALLDVWFSKNGITVWTHSGKSVRDATEQDILDAITKVKQRYGI